MKVCIYCGSRPGKTKDHVPPVSYFREILPNGVQRITVPCCEECRRTGEKDETICRNLIISNLQSEQHPIALKLAEKRDKSMALDRSLGERAAAQLRYVMTIMPHGPMLVPAIDYDIEPLHGFVLRMCRALLHEESKCGFRPCKIIKWGMNPGNEEWAIFKQAPSRVISEEFGYAHIYFRGEKHSAWLLQFYEGVLILAVMETEWDH